MVFIKNTRRLSFAPLAIAGLFLSCAWPALAQTPEGITVE